MTMVMPIRIVRGGLAIVGVCMKMRRAIAMIVAVEMNTFTHHADDHICAQTNQHDPDQKFQPLRQRLTDSETESDSPARNRHER